MTRLEVQPLTFPELIELTTRRFADERGVESRSIDGRDRVPRWPRGSVTVRLSRAWTRTAEEQSRGKSTRRTAFAGGRLAPVVRRSFGVPTFGGAQIDAIVPAVKGESPG